jgi:hypothetical protein
MSKPDKPTDLLIDDDGEGIISKVTQFLGIQQEAFTCDHCGTPCEKSYTYHRETAAFNNGAQPSWECPDCEREYVREPDDDRHTVDLYGR